MLKELRSNVVTSYWNKILENQKQQSNNDYWDEGEDEEEKVETEINEIDLLSDEPIFIIPDQELWPVPFKKIKINDYDYEVAGCRETALGDICSTPNRKKIFKYCPIRFFFYYGDPKLSMDKVIEEIKKKAIIVAKHMDLISIGWYKKVGKHSFYFKFHEKFRKHPQLVSLLLGIIKTLDENCDEVYEFDQAFKALCKQNNWIRYFDKLYGEDGYKTFFENGYGFKAADAGIMTWYNRDCED